MGRPLGLTALTLAVAGLVACLVAWWHRELRRLAWVAEWERKWEAAGA